MRALACKYDLVATLRPLGHEVVDFGAKEYVAGDDNPDFVVPLCVRCQLPEELEQVSAYLGATGR